MTAAVPGDVKKGHLAKARRLKIPKGAIASLFVLLLLALGIRGKERVRLQAKVDGIVLAREELQRRLADEPGPAGTNSTRMGQSVSNPNLKESSVQLRALLGQFETEPRRNKLNDVQNLDVRMAEATLANAEQRFGDALTIIGAEDEKRTGSTELRQRTLQIRGDSLFGLHQWHEALEYYRQVSVLDTNHLGTKRRIAECLYALGNSSEGFATYHALARNYFREGDTLVTGGDLGAAIGRYGRGIEIGSFLIEQSGPAQRQSELKSELAQIRSSRGNAFLVQGKLAAAVEDFEKAMALRLAIKGEGDSLDLANSYENLANGLLAQTKLSGAMAHFEKAIEMEIPLSGGKAELERDLAKSYSNLANCLLGQRKLETALEQYGKAIALQSRFDDRQSLGELAMSYNNRGVVHRIEGRLDPAVADFEKALAVLGPVLRSAKQAITNRASASYGRLKVRLDVPVGYTERAIEAVPRARLADDETRLSVVFATSLKNLGYARLSQGKTDLALNEFIRSADIYGQLVEREGHADLALEFSRSLMPPASIYALSADRSFRDGRKAKEYAFKACVQTEWKTVAPVEMLAAACAEAGDGSEAVKLQEKAIELAPGNQKAALRSKLELYKSGLKSK